MTPVDSPPIRRSRRLGRGLAVLAVVALCAVPATDALAAGKGRKAPKPKPKPKATITRVAPAPAGLDLDREAVRRGWGWGAAVRGQIVTPGKTGLQTVQFQRGVITGLTGTTITVTSVDQVSVVWQLRTSTAVVVPKGAPRRPGVIAAVEPSPTDTPTASPTDPTDPPADPPLTGKLTLGLRVKVWGLGADDQLSARLIIADPRAPKPTAPPTASPTATPTISPTGEPTPPNGPSSEPSDEPDDPTVESSDPDDPPPVD